jgi:hypothetical protein
MGESRIPTGSVPFSGWGAALPLSSEHHSPARPFMAYY